MVAVSKMYCPAFRCHQKSGSVTPCVVQIKRTSRRIKNSRRRVERSMMTNLNSIIRALLFPCSCFESNVMLRFCNKEQDAQCAAGDSESPFDQRIATFDERAQHHDSALPAILLVNGKKIRRRQH